MVRRFLDIYCNSHIRFPDLICNGGINPYVTPLSTTIINVPAGGQFTAEWHHTLAGLTPGDSQDPIDPSHKGPIITYL